MVDVCLVGQKDIFRTVMNVKPDIIALGYDQTHHEEYIKAECAKIGVNVRVIRLYTITNARHVKFENTRRRQCYEGFVRWCGILKTTTNV